MNRPRTIALALLFGGGALSAVAAARPPPTTPASASRNIYRQQGRERAGEIRELLAALPAKTTQEKLEDAYDGAVRTHEIGFPKSRVR